MWSDGRVYPSSKGGGRDCIVSVHDPEMRNGRKSYRQLMTVAELPSNAPDAQDAVDLMV